MKISIDLDEDDFQMLWINSTEWSRWKERPDGRFRTVKDGGEIVPSYRHVYWFQDAVSMILARAWLQDAGHPHQVLWDEYVTDDSAGDPLAIITDYLDPRDDFDKLPIDHLTDAGVNERARRQLENDGLDTGEDASAPD